TSVLTRLGRSMTVAKQEVTALLGQPYRISSVMPQNQNIYTTAQETAVPKNLPTRKVKPEARATTRSCRMAERRHRPLVDFPSSAPIAIAAPPGSPNELATALVPVVTNHGTRGTNAPHANVTNDDMAEAQAEPISCGLTPSPARPETVSACSGSRKRSLVVAAAVAWLNPCCSIVACKMARSRWGPVRIASRFSSRSRS